MLHAWHRLIGMGAAALVLGAAGGSAFAADEKSEIVVGFADSKSGFMAAFSGPSGQAARMAIDDLNAKGGLLGKPIRIVEADAKSDRTESAKAGAEVISAGADMVVVDCDFDWGSPAALQAENAGLISFFLCAEDAKAGPEGIGPFAFTSGNAAHSQGSALAEWAHEKKGARNAYLLLDEVLEYDRSVCAGFRWAWGNLDGTAIVGEDVFKNDDASIAAQITRLKAAEPAPDVIMLCSFVPGGASALRQIRAAGIETPVYGPGAMDGTFWVDAVPGLSDFYVTAIGSVYGDDPDPAVEQFMQRFADKYGERPVTGYALPGYALIEMWSRAVERAGTVESRAVVAELEKMTDEPTVAGPRSFSSELHIQNKVRYLIVSFTDGKPKAEGYWTTGPVPKDVLLTNR
ncbi:MAG: ABC transporter substrate-binding protein [Alphaproteobacteria bacterium]